METMTISKDRLRIVLEVYKKGAISLDEAELLLKEERPISQIDPGILTGNPKPGWSDLVHRTIGKLPEHIMWEPPGHTHNPFIGFNDTTAGLRPSQIATSSLTTEDLAKEYLKERNR